MATTLLVPDANILVNAVHANTQERLKNLTTIPDFLGTLFAHPSTALADLAEALDDHRAHIGFVTLQTAHIILERSGYDNSLATYCTSILGGFAHPHLDDTLTWHSLRQDAQHIHQQWQHLCPTLVTPPGGRTLYNDRRADYEDAVQLAALQRIVANHPHHPIEWHTSDKFASAAAAHTADQLNKEGYNVTIRLHQRTPHGYETGIVTADPTTGSAHYTRDHTNAHPLYIHPPKNKHTATMAWGLH